MSVVATTRRLHLTPSQRAELVDLIGGQPLATCREIARIFEARTGRAVCAETVRYAWVAGDRYAVDRWNRPLTESERSMLERICRASAPGYNRREIARRFEAEAGRRITRPTVRAFLRETLGIMDPPLLGRPRKAVTA